jgi:glucuronyl/N-acetylglucosaminyl transferase EXT1
MRNKSEVDPSPPNQGLAFPHHIIRAWPPHTTLTVVFGFFCRYYNYYYAHNLPSSIHELMSTSEGCQDMILNFIVSHVTRQPPVKILDRKPYKEEIVNLYKRQSSASKEHFTRFEDKRQCFETLADEFGYMPLVYTAVRFDPVLYKDPISNFRKKYRLLEV